MKYEKIAQDEHVIVIGEDRTTRSLVATGAFKALPNPKARRPKGMLKAGDLAVISGAPVPKILKKLGHKDSVEAILQALLIDAKEKPFTEVELAEATKVAKAAPDDTGRKDLRSLVTFTIDGDYSRDFDDAISAKREGNQFRIWVHVADVTAYVMPGSILDLASKKRATSIYLPTMVSPMLPEVLSNGICSLVPHQERRALTCEMLLEGGKVVSFDFYRSLIKSDARLTYDKVNQMFLGLLEPGPTYSAALDAAREASDADNFDDGTYADEPSFRITQGRVEDIYYTKRGSSQHLIERLMILANQTAAQFIADNAPKDQTLYRAHDGKSLVKVEQCLAKLKSMGVDAKSLTDATDKVTALHTKNEISHDRFEAYLELIRHTNIAAEYTIELRPHSGLAIAAYTHFTSPIRRYADILVHRMILDAIKIQSFTIDPLDLKRTIDHINERNRTAKKLERKSVDICKASYLAKEIKNKHTVYEGIVTGMFENGLFVKIDNAEGMLSKRDIGGHMDIDGAIWRRANPLEDIFFGDKISVRVKNVDQICGRVKLALC